MGRGTRYRLNPTPEQAASFERSASCARFLYNAALEHRMFAYRTFGVTVQYWEQANDLPAIKRASGFEFLKDVQADVLQQALRDVDRAYNLFFRGVTGFPKFKVRGRSKDSFRLQRHRTTAGHDIEVERLIKRWGRIKVPKVGWVRFRWTRGFTGEIGNITISRDALAWHVSIAYRDASEARTPRESGSATVVLQRGLMKYTGDGQFLAAHRAFQHKQGRDVRTTHEHALAA